MRLYLLQNLYDLSDEATAAEAIDSRAFSRCLRVDSSIEVHNGGAFDYFRNLQKNGMQEINQDRKLSRIWQRINSSVTSGYIDRGGFAFLQRFIGSTAGANTCNDNKDLRCNAIFHVFKHI